jgi:glycerophosphoryl diester phosphodiesterase
VRFNIETKLSPLSPDEAAPPEVFVDILLETIHETALQSRVTIQSFDWRTLRLVQLRAPDISTSYLTAERAEPFNVASDSAASIWTDGYNVRDFAGSVPRMIEAAGGAIWSPDYAELSAERVLEAHSLGVEVLPWTVNDETDMRRLIEWDVDGLISDYPDVLARVAFETLGFRGD